jgi:hypothetical protein
VQAAVVESLADGVSLGSLGSFLAIPRAAGAGGSLQVAAADLIADFPPLRSVTEAE